MKKKELVSKINIACTGILDNIEGLFYDSDAKVEFTGINRQNNKIHRVNIYLKVDDIIKKSVEDLKKEISIQIENTINK